MADPVVRLDMDTLCAWADTFAGEWATSPLDADEATAQWHVDAATAAGYEGAYEALGDGWLVKVRTVP